ncbi:MAG: 2-C-methyl-D-erythritol 4-phosphate cytidylyltransferase [Bacillota bacterium]
MNYRKVSAVILAAGTGSRMGLRKQFLYAGGRPLISYSLCTFDSCEEVDEVVLVCRLEDLPMMKFIVNNLGLSKLKKVVTGGETRQESARRGLEALDAESGLVLIHDAARPLVSKELIRRLIAEAEHNEAVVPGLAVKDTVKFVGQDGYVLTTPRRESVFVIQTPQLFTVSLIKRAHLAALEAGWSCSDDASLVEKLGVRVKVIEGEESNFKVTTPKDVSYLEFVMMKATTAGHRAVDFSPRVGLGFDVHRIAPGRKLVLGGVEIPWEAGLLGHSDGDVVCHALMDAMLGAAGMRDIGHMFPPSDHRFEGAYSLGLVNQVAASLLRQGLCLERADLVVVAEEPKLAPYVERMCELLASATGTSPDKISIKATTAEGLGFVGRKEGMCCWCVATLMSLESR